MDIAIPLPVYHHCAYNRLLSPLRTFSCIKYMFSVGSGRFVLNTLRISEVLRCTQQTVRNHLKKLIEMGWINEAGNNVYYCRGWKRIVRLLGIFKYRVVKTKLDVIFSLKQLKAFSLFAVCLLNIHQQSYNNGRKRPNALREAILPEVLISCKKLAEWFGKSEKIGSVYRRLIADYGFWDLTSRWEEVPNVPYLLKEYQDRNRILIFLPCGKVLSPVCSTLTNILTFNVSFSRRSAK